MLAFYSLIPFFLPCPFLLPPHPTAPPLNFLLFLLLFSSSFMSQLTLLLAYGNSFCLLVFFFRVSPLLTPSPLSSAIGFHFSSSKLYFSWHFFPSSCNPLEAFWLETEDSHQLAVLISHKTQHSCLLSTGYSGKVSVYAKSNAYAGTSKWFCPRFQDFEGQSFVCRLLSISFSLGTMSCSCKLWFAVVGIILHSFSDQNTKMSLGFLGSFNLLK